MTVESGGDGRTRGWVLVRAERGMALEVAERMSEELGNPNGAFVVRADVVAGPYDIVVAVDAESPEALTELIVHEIQNIEGIMETVTLVVGMHHPWPPHFAAGYVSEEEAGASNPIEAGPLGNNAWG